MKSTAEHGSVGGRLQAKVRSGSITDSLRTTDLGCARTRHALQSAVGAPSEHQSTAVRQSLAEKWDVGSPSMGNCQQQSALGKGMLQTCDLAHGARLHDTKSRSMDRGGREEVHDLNI